MKIQKRTITIELLRLCRFRPMILVYMIWQGMYGNGVATGIGLIIILNVRGVVSDPQGPVSSFDPDEPTVFKRVVRGGSFLCTDQYCSGFRVAARMKTSPDTSLEHTGFRCVVSEN